MPDHSINELIKWQWRTHYRPFRSSTTILFPRMESIFVSLSSVCLCQVSSMLLISPPIDRQCMPPASGRRPQQLSDHHTAILPRCYLVLSLPCIPSGPRSQRGGSCGTTNRAPARYAHRHGIPSYSSSSFSCVAAVDRSSHRCSGFGHLAVSEFQDSSQ